VNQFIRDLFFELMRKETPMSKCYAFILAVCLGIVIAPHRVFAEDLKTLEDGAKKEGKINLYGSMREDEAKPVLDTFQRTYGGVRVDYFRSSEDKLISRILTEAKARNYS
jgi:hypothetical protein